jgi:hypothetical protein
MEMKCSSKSASSPVVGVYLSLGFWVAEQPFFLRRVRMPDPRAQPTKTEAAASARVFNEGACIDVRAGREIPDHVIPNASTQKKIRFLANCQSKKKLKMHARQSTYCEDMKKK